MKNKTKLWLFYGSLALVVCDGYLLLSRVLGSIAFPISVPKVSIAVAMQILVLLATYIYVEAVVGSPLGLAISYFPQRLRHIPFLALLGLAVLSLLVLSSGLFCGELPVFPSRRGAQSCW